ncbi:phosphopantetheine-binding protein [Sphingobium subterraneum]|uniref:Acyl carrier protein n=1 Tax=Sphingobium subterraneum TaxID=627688 RepID=A0A841J2M1_9SPHN|nr:acyl carrier protein [Sphingobium subterraneum]
MAAALRQAAPECSDSIDRMTPATEISDLGLNSIKLLEAAAYLEEAAKASFPDDRLAKVVKVQDLIQLVREHGTIDPQAFNEK